jgi:lipopolysaccharide/colanic/teichoic acid biosynthesis glycosyltransferase
MRVFPKLLLTKRLYFFITRGKNRVLTRAETFGRLYSCGFEIVAEQTINNKLYFVTRKIKQPYFDADPSYGLLISLKRIGKDGKLINVYKLRTMHAYAEYLQEYVHKQNSLEEGGKFKNDFRITPIGKIFRKLWLDEIPMLVNLLNGTMKLVGVRPISEHYFSLYSQELQLKRIKYKPGLIPPFYSDMPKTMGEIMESEMRYLEAYENHPFRTDLKYFFKAFYNILLGGARSA